MSGIPPHDLLGAGLLCRHGPVSNSSYVPTVGLALSTIALSTRKAPAHRPRGARGHTLSTGTRFIHTQYIHPSHKELQAAVVKVEHGIASDRIRISWLDIT